MEQGVEGEHVGRQEKALHKAAMWQMRLQFLHTFEYIYTTLGS